MSHRLKLQIHRYIEEAETYQCGCDRLLPGCSLGLLETGRVALYIALYSVQVTELKQAEGKLRCDRQ
ncbi:MAG: hypothetical protein HC899_02370 [Leptolyngbyaceae cyanobacterium SM1_4_3]|nr:hypothetical protein [Leptolyngbyaceae cyanobacterium SM1_4_3]